MATWRIRAVGEIDLRGRVQQPRPRARNTRPSSLRWRAAAEAARAGQPPAGPSPTAPASARSWTCSPPETPPPSPSSCTAATGRRWTAGLVQRLRPRLPRTPTASASPSPPTASPLPCGSAHILRQVRTDRGPGPRSATAASAPSSSAIPPGVTWPPACCQRPAPPPPSPSAASSTCAPLIPTSLNAALRLDENEAAALSPVFWPIPNGSTPGGTVLDCVVGADESPEFLRQSKHDGRPLGRNNGVQTRYDALPGLDHFTVLDSAGRRGQRAGEAESWNWRSAARPRSGSPTPTCRDWRPHRHGRPVA
jgi:arylformamidase